MRHVVIIVVAVLGLATTVRGENIELAKELYISAITPAIIDQVRVNLLLESMVASPSYAAAYELGRSYNILGQVDKAISAFEQAAVLTLDSSQEAKVLGIVAQLYQANGDTPSAVLTYKRVLHIQPSPEFEQDLRNLERSQNGMTAASVITSSLKRGLAKRSLGVVPAIDLRISFAVNTANLDAAGKDQVKELGSALSDPSFTSQRIRLVGHTDKRGTDAHNDRLSVQRAQTVKKCLTAGYGISADRIIVDGKGKREPLYMGDNEEDYALNRRVAVQLEE
jgi:outer membrane protein OmpA-like peptidoglycan-associated protein